MIVGQDRVVERLLVCLLARGHCLLEGVPGLAKTLAAETLAAVVGGTFARLQFTPDLLPADIVGTRIYRASTETFDVELGPVFANFVLADEINRAPAKVQSALLEVMAEHQVSIGGKTFEVPRAVPRARHPEPDRVRGRVPAARGAARPLPHEDRRRLPDPHRGGRDRPPHGRRPARGRTRCIDLGPICCALQAAADAVYVDRGVVDYAVSLVLATRDPGRVRPADVVEPLPHLRRQPPRQPRPRRRRPGARAACGAATTCCPRTCSTSRPTCSATASCSSYEALAEGDHASTRSSRGCSPPCPHRASLRRTTARPTLAPPQVPTAPAPDPFADRGDRRRRGPPAPPGCRRRPAARVLTPPCPDRPAPPDPFAAAAATDPATAGSHDSPAPPRADHHPPPRRPAAGRLPRPRARPRLRARRDPRATPPATTCAASTGTSPPACRHPTSATTIADRELETWMRRRPARPASTSAPRDCEKRDLAARRHRGRRLPHRPHRQPHRRRAARPADRVQRVPGPGGPDAPAGPPAPVVPPPSPVRGRRRTPTSRPASAASPARSRRRGLVVVISDFLDRERLGASRCARSAPRHEVLAIEVVDPRELELPDGRACSRSSTPRPGDIRRGRRPPCAASAPATPRRPPTQRAAIAAASARAGADHLQLRTDRDWLLDLVRYVARRRMRARRASGVRVSR